jgi:hypothetical protein
VGHNDGVPNEAGRLSARFDEMLETSRRDLDALYRDENGKPSRLVLSRGARSAHTSSSERAVSGFDPRSTPTARVLDDWFGGRWRFEITDRRHDGDEVVVSGRVVVENQGIEMSGTGRAAVATGNAAIEGTTAGIVFRVKPAHAMARDSVGGPEDSAFRQAAAVALARCAQLP